MVILTAISGIKNAFFRNDMAAQNIANLNTKGYQQKDVYNTSIKSGGVKSVIETESPQIANKNNVNIEKQTVNTNNNVIQEKANIDVIEAQNEMIDSLIDMKV